MSDKTKLDKPDRGNKINKKDKQPDDDYKCPITLDYMKEPVIAQDGHIYEKSAIENWFENHDHSPITRQKIDKQLTTCYFFNEKLEDFYKTNNIIKQITERDLLSPFFKNFDEKSILKYLQIINDMNDDDLVLLFKNTNFINFLIDKYPIDYKDERNWMMIHYICEYGTYDMLKKIVSKKEVDLEAKTQDNWRPMHILCSYAAKQTDEDRLNSIKLMIKQDVELNVKTVNGLKPIDLICELDNVISRKYYIEIVQLLINAGATVKRLKIHVS